MFQKSKRRFNFQYHHRNEDCVEMNIIIEVYSRTNTSF